MSCKFDNGVVLFYAVDELPEGVSLKWGDVTTHQKLVKGTLYLWTISSDTHLCNTGQLRLDVRLIIRSKRKCKSKNWSIMCYTHILPITSMSTAGYINVLTRSVGTRPFDLYSRDQQNPVRIENTASTHITPTNGLLPDDSNNLGTSQPISQGDKELLLTDRSISLNEEYDNNSYDDYWGSFSDNDESISGSGGNDKSGSISYIEQENGSLSHEQDILDTDADLHGRTSSYGGTETTIWASDAYEYAGEAFNSPIDYEIGVKEEGGRVIVSNPYDDPIVQEYVDDTYMSQYQDDIDEYDNNSSDDDPYSDWSDSWDAWEL